MQKKLQLLEELQRLDLKVDGLKGEKKALLSEIEALDARRDESRRKVAEREALIAELEGEKKGLEDGLAAEADNISRSESRQKEIKTQKEYQAVAKEISAAKKQQTEIEEQILQKLSRIEEVKTELTAIGSDLQQQESQLESQKGSVQEKVSAIDQSIASDSAVRESVAKNIPASMLKRYELLRERRQGLAVVEAKAGSCLGCNMNLPPQIYNSLFRVDDLITCPHCQRVLFVRQESDCP